MVQQIAVRRVANPDSSAHCIRCGLAYPTMYIQGWVYVCSVTPDHRCDRPTRTARAHRAFFQDDEE